MKGKQLLIVATTCVAILTTHLAFGGEKIKQSVFVVNLTSPISTKDSKPGDTFTAVVLEPAEHAGSVVEGHIRKVEPAKNMEAPKSRILFGIETLTEGDKTYKIQTELQNVVNSKGMAKVDEEGQVIAKGNAGKRALAGIGGGGLGSFAGGMLGGGIGSLAGGLAGGALGYVIALDVTASSHNIEFYPGSHFTIEVTSKGEDKNADSAGIKKLEADNEALQAQKPAPVSAPAQ
jgi:hypothetical protein